MTPKSQRMLGFYKTFQDEICTRLNDFKVIQKRTQKEIIKQNLYILGITILFLSIFIIMVCLEIAPLLANIIGTITLIISFRKIFSIIENKKKIVTNYYKKFKEQYYNNCLLKPFDELTYNENKTTLITLNSLNPSIMFYNLFLNPPNHIVVDDVFNGKYKELTFEFAEVDLGYGESYGLVNGYSKFYHCAVLRFELFKDIKAKTLILPKGNLHFYDLPDNQNLEEVKLEYTDFEQRYSVYSQDQIECRYLLTTSFLERFMQLKISFSSDDLKAYFNPIDNSLSIIIPIKNRNLFEIVSLWKNLDCVKEKANELYSELISVYDLLEEIHLYKNIKI